MDRASVAHWNELLSLKVVEARCTLVYVWHEQPIYAVKRGTKPKTDGIKRRRKEREPEKEESKNEAQVNVTKRHKIKKAQSKGYI